MVVPSLGDRVICSKTAAKSLLEVVVIVSAGSPVVGPRSAPLRPPGGWVVADISEKGESTTADRCY